MVKTETWKPIDGYADSYEVSNRGRVRSRERDINGPHGLRRIGATVLKPRDGGSPNAPHLRAKLWADNKQRTLLIHRLVLESFVGPCPDGMVACHIDGDPHNNDIDNLRWDTASSNTLDSVRHGTHPAASKTHCKRGHEFTPENTIAQHHGGRRCRTCRAQSERSRTRAA